MTAGGIERDAFFFNNPTKNRIFDRWFCNQIRWKIENRFQTIRQRHETIGDSRGIGLVEIRQKIQIAMARIKLIG